MAIEQQITASQVPLRKHVFTLAWPAIVEMSLHMAVGIIDTAMVGRLGAVSLVGVGLAHQVFFLSTTLFAAVGTGNTALVARHIGAKEPEQAGQVARQSLLLGSLTAVLIMVMLFLYSEQIFGLLFGSADPEVLAISIRYVQIVSMVLVFHLFLVLVNGSLRGAGDTKTPMRITGIVNLFNVVGNAVLIFGLGPFPALGVTGAAIATACAHVLGGILAVLTLLRTPSIQVSLRGPYRFDPVTIKRILKIGVPAALEQGSMRLGQLFFAMVVASLGTVSYAAHQVALNAESISFMPGFGFSLAATTLVGQNLGANRMEEAENSGYSANQMAMAVMTVMGVVFFLFPTPLVRVFTTDPEVIRLASAVLRLIAVCQPGLATLMVLAGGLRGAGDTSGILKITIVGFLGIRLGLAYLLAIQLGFGLIGAWTAMAIDLNVRGLWVWLRYRQGRWKNLKV